MEIKLTEEQYDQIRQDRVLDISAPINGIRVYIEYSENMDADYIEIYHRERPVFSRRDYAFCFEDLEKLKAKKPSDPSWYHDKPLCPACGTYMIYNFEHCPKCGQKIDWSGFTGDR